MLNWLEIMHDWPISRQIVWGIRIPVWYKIVQDRDRHATLAMTRGDQYNAITVSFIDKNGERKHGNVYELLKAHDLGEIKEGLQSLTASTDTPYEVSVDSPGENYLPETDTFDTWFSSGQWPIVTNPPNYPTDLMGTYSDILKFWVSRMMMFGIYLKNDVPFRDVYLWSMVADKNGLKMSKSKGNVVDPMEFVEKYGADALRMSLMFGVKSGGKIIFSEDKVRGMRNFANKIWNVARFVKGEGDVIARSEVTKQSGKDRHASLAMTEQDKWILEELRKTVEIVTKSLEKYEFNIASEEIYEFVWHKFADVYIEEAKERKEDAQPVLNYVLITSLKLLHPFMPFVTEAVWKEIGVAKTEGMLIRSEWPQSITWIPHPSNSAGRQVRDDTG
jgi:valyl-tRNA synthetase